MADEFGPGPLLEDLCCEISESHEIALGIDTVDTGYCVDCGQRRRLVQRTNVRISLEKRSVGGPFATAGGGYQPLPTDSKGEPPGAE